MKKQKFNGKLRLKKNVISNLSAGALRGGTNDSFLPQCELTFDTCNTGSLCTYGCPPIETQHVDCRTEHVQTDCRCL
ncbi:class I lanthipeptide [Roseivirga misakiensis]|uniref:class I lanthipeptide n=1 Tax=Roseivirga misakiensis TaxID=1563681 RepID=UPI00114CB659|nr:class I lanthipeptide [Roseivirga misakiensis]